MKRTVRIGLAGSERTILESTSGGVRLEATILGLLARASRMARRPRNVVSLLSELCWDLQQEERTEYTERAKLSIVERRLRRLKQDMDYYDRALKLRVES